MYNLMNWKGKPSSVIEISFPGAFNIGIPRKGREVVKVMIKKEFLRPSKGFFRESLMEKMSKTMICPWPTPQKSLIENQQKLPGQCG